MDFHQVIFVPPLPFLPPSHRQTNFSLRQPYTTENERRRIWCETAGLTFSLSFGRYQPHIRVRTGTCTPETPKFLCLLLFLIFIPETAKSLTVFLCFRLFMRMFFRRSLAVVRQELREHQNLDNACKRCWSSMLPRSVIFISFSGIFID